LPSAICHGRHRAPSDAPCHPALAAVAKCVCHPACLPRRVPKGVSRSHGRRADIPVRSNFRRIRQLRNWPHHIALLCSLPKGISAPRLDDSTCIPRLPVPAVCTGPASCVILKPVVHNTTLPFQSVPQASAIWRDGYAVALSNPANL
jgi:hypothetical protein